MTEAEFNAGRNEAGRVAEVVADAIMDHDVDGVPLGNEQIDGVGKLQLSALPRLDAAKDIKIAHFFGQRPVDTKFDGDSSATGVSTIHVFFSPDLRRKSQHQIRHISAPAAARPPPQHQTVTLLADPNHLAHGDGELNSVVRKHNHK